MGNHNRNIERDVYTGRCFGENEETMSEQALLAIAPIVSLIILVGIVGFYFARKERRESQNANANKRN